MNRARSGACRNCRIRKRRCLPCPSTDDGCCQLCAQQSTSCSLTRSNPIAAGPNHPIIPADNPLSSCLPQPRDINTLATSSSTRQEWRLPQRLLLRELVELYFCYIHDGPHTLFHEPTFLSGLELGRIPDFVLFAVISLSTRFSTNDYFHGDARSYALVYAAAAIELLQKEMVRPSLESIQACILISQHLGGEGDVEAKHICTGLARLHCQCLRIWDISSMPLVEQEVAKRTYLSVLITGNWSTADMSIAPVASEYPAQHLPLLDEEDFLVLRKRPQRHGLWAQMAQTIDIFREILEVIILLSSGELLAAQIKKVSQLAQRLDQWENQLPERLKYRPDNLEYFQQNGFEKTFLAMHIGYHHYRQLLYFPFLDPRNDNHLASECKKHAMMVSEIASRGGKLVYYIIGHILVVSSSIHLHTLLLGGGDVDRARQYLLSNFNILIKLKSYWPMIDAAVAKLRSFQNHCRMSSLDSFVLDDWMWKFLIAQSAVLGEQRVSRAGPQRSPLVNHGQMDNAVLVETALTWLLDE
ncbi:hypothetical protein VTL71DRAFT_16584 [Oculimacula yallundae]|uniref:Zn(2)-C6 fungal-type domain-containing protein n=1 Tax=Oculimacula yallundae TaxID=86028 RepID=A0ABR4CEU8_9HELO